MHKRALHHLWVRLRPFRYAYFLALAIALLVIGLYSLRQNNMTSIRLRDEVLKADQANGDVETALNKLRLHMYSHMNSSLSNDGSIQQPIQLKYRYERLVQAEKDRVSKLNEKIYSEAQADCERRFPSGLSGSTRIPCISEYVASRGVKEQPIPDAMYKYDFASPVWSPDLAGFSLVFGGVFFILFIIRFWLEHWLRNSLE